MAAINNQATLRTAVADWLNRNDLSDTLIDSFVEIGEARIYEELRVPTLEALAGFTVTESHITLPSGFNELIELRKVGSGSCTISPEIYTNRSSCASIGGIWSDSDRDDDISLRRLDGHTFHNNKIANAFTREIGSLLLTDSQGNRSAKGEYALKYYRSDDAVGTIDKDGNEIVPWILGTEYELVLFAALAAGSIYLGDLEAQQKFDELTARKVMSLNEKTKKADLKGGIFTANFSSSII